MPNNFGNVLCINPADGTITLGHQFAIHPGEPIQNILNSELYWRYALFYWADVNKKSGPVFLGLTHDTADEFIFRLEFYQSRLRFVNLSILSVVDGLEESVFQQTLNGLFEDGMERFITTNGNGEPLTYKFPWGTVKADVDFQNSFAKLFIEYSMSIALEETSIGEKIEPLFSYATGKLKKEIEHVPDYVELARKYRREEFAKSLGYRNWDALIIRSVCFFEYQSLNFYFSKNQTTGRVLVWHDRLFEIIVEFTGWLECFRAMETAQLHALMEKEIEKFRKKENQMGWGIF